ncbi:MAG: hypothetical protein K1X92_10500 [Bacteroidia bacterium]|nr:hypothetical protein [Bacteroidia bacterium]
MQYNRFEEKLRERLAGAEMQPAPVIWSNIRREIQPPAPKRPGNWKWFIVLILGLTCGSLFYLHQKSQPQSFAAVQPPSKIRKVVKGIHSDTNTQSAEVQNPAQVSPAQIQSSPVIPADKRISGGSIPHKNEMVTNRTVSKDKVETSPVAVQQSNATPVPPQLAVQSAASAQTNPVAAKINVVKEVSENKPVAPPVNNSGIAARKEVVNISLQNQNFPSSLNTQLPHISPKSLAVTEAGLNKKTGLWTTVINSGLSMIVYQPFYSNGNGRAINPLSVNTVGIATFAASGDSAQAVTVEDIQTFNEVTSGNFDAEYIKMTVSPVTYFIGVGASRKLDNKLSIDGGLKLHYQQTRRIILPTKNISNYYQVVYNSKNSISTIQGKKENNFDFYVMEFPVMLNYDLPLKKSRSAFSAGMGTSYRLLMNGLFADNAPVKNGNTLISRNTYTVYQEHNFSVNFRLMYQFHLNEKTGVYIAGNTQALIKPMYNRTISYKTPILFGVETGVRF